VLRELASVPISTWGYRTHHIASVDADGVALAAVKGLNRKLTAKVDRLERRLASFERRVGSAR
jgi:hypothetical protein